MYLAQFEDIRQACMRLTPPRPGVDGDWWSIYEQLVGGVASIAGWSAYVRVVLTPGRGLDHILVIAAHKDEETKLRETMAAFLRIAVVSVASIEVPLSADQYDEMTAGFPPYRCYIDASFDQSSARWFACDFRVAPLLPRLLTLAQLRGYRIGYQANLQSFDPSGAQKKEVLKNVSYLHSIRGMTPKAVALQQRLAENFTHATALVDEYLAVNTPQAAAWLTGELDLRFEERYERYHFGPLSSCCTLDGYEDQLTSPALDAPIDALDYACSHAVGREEIVAIASVRADADVATRYLLPPRASLAGPTRKVHRTRGAVAAPGVFVSYKREDLSRVEPIIHLLRTAGWSVWYDQDIPGGTQWMDELEERLRSSFVVLVFLSEQSIRSDYVKLEVLYAHSIQSTIVPVSLEPVTRAGGMALILAATQQLERNHPAFETRLLGAVARAAEDAGVERIGA